MSYREKRGGTGERVLESRHVIGLFMLMLLFSGVFFTLGYMMGRDQYGGQVRAATDFFKKPASSVPPKPDTNSKRTNNSTPSATPTDTAVPPNSDWEFYHAGDSNKTEDHLKSVACSRRLLHAAGGGPEERGGGAGTREGSAEKEFSRFRCFSAD